LDSASGTRSIEQIGAFRKGALDRPIHRIFDGIRYGKPVERLGLDHNIGKIAQRRCQISPCDVLGAQYRLQFVARQRGRTAGFQYVRQSGQPLFQTFLRGLLDGFGIGEAGTGCNFLAGGIQQSIVGLLHLENDPAVSVVKRKVGGQCVRRSRAYSTGPPPKSKTR